MNHFSRRSFLSLAGSAALLGLSGARAAPASRRFRIRTITAGIGLESAGDVDRINAVIEMLTQMKAEYEAGGYTVQTLRIATQPLAEYLPGWGDESSIAALAQLDRLAAAHDVVLALGPIIAGNEHRPALPGWAEALVRATTQINFSVSVASPELGIHRDTLRSAAEVIAALSRSGTGGQDNFRFTASAFVPPGTPFFPAAWHSGPDAISIGLETPNLLNDVFAASNGLADAGTQLTEALQQALSPVESIGKALAQTHSVVYGGIDVSPAPGPDASIGEAIETMTGQPFGSASTLAACAAITSALKSVQVKTCGYSGLMLPVVEDRVLAQRAAEGRYGIGELLLYSSVCGTGLDVVPLPGDLPVEALERIIGDVAALALKYRKPLSARLFPIPGKHAGDRVDFDHPFLTGSVVFDAE